MNLINIHREEVFNLCEKYGVTKLYSFGSVDTDSFGDESDIDLVVDFETDDPIKYTDNYFGLKFDLQEILKRSIDLLEAKSVNNPYLKRSIDNSRVLIYARAN